MAGGRLEVVQNLGQQVLKMGDVEGVGRLGDDRGDIAGIDRRRRRREGGLGQVRVEDERVALADIDGEDAVVEILVAAAIHVLETQRYQAFIDIHGPHGMGNPVGIEGIAVVVGPRGGVVDVALDPDPGPGWRDIPKVGIDALDARRRPVGVAELEMPRREIDPVIMVVLAVAVGDDEEAHPLAGLDAQRARALAGNEMTAPADLRGIGEMEPYVADMTVAVHLVAAERVVIAGRHRAEDDVAFVILGHGVGLGRAARPVEGKPQGRALDMGPPDQHHAAGRAGGSYVAKGIRPRLAGLAQDSMLGQATDIVGAVRSDRHDALFHAVRLVFVAEGLGVEQTVLRLARHDIDAVVASGQTGHEAFEILDAVGEDGAPQG